MSTEQQYLGMRGILGALMGNAQAAREQAVMAEEVVDNLADQDGEEARHWRTVIERAESLADAFDDLRKYLISRQS